MLLISPIGIFPILKVSIGISDDLIRPSLFVDVGKGSGCHQVISLLRRTHSGLPWSWCAVSRNVI